MGRRELIAAIAVGIAPVAASACSESQHLDEVSDLTQASNNPHDAVNVSYCAIASHLAANNVQTAIDVLASHPIGAAGPVGPVGPVGPTGATGAVGAAGLDGTAGVSVLSSPGTSCPLGGARFDGADGAVFACSAAPGMVGDVGMSGPIGAEGTVGVPGLAGLVGPAGSAGIDGGVGPQGEAGPIGPIGAVPLAPMDWQTYFDGRFYGLASFVTVRVGSHVIEAPSVVWSSGIGRFDSTTVTTQSFESPSAIDQLPPMLIATVDHSQSPPRPVLIMPGTTHPHSSPTAVASYIQVDLTTSAVHSIALRSPAAVANVTAHGERGGYVFDNELRFFELATDRRQLVLSGGDSEEILIRDLDATLGTTTACPHVAITEMFHDADSRRLLLLDSCNNLIWVLGYRGPHGPIELHTTIAPRLLGHIAYDHARHILWSGGTYGMAIDLSTL